MWFHIVQLVSLHMYFSSYSVIILLLCFATALLFVFFKCLLEITIFTFRHHRTVLTASTILSLTDGFAVSMTGTECFIFLLWLVSLWVLLSSCCGCCSKFHSMYSSVSVFLSLDSWFLRYCSAVMGVVFTSLLLLVISHPIFIIHTVYHWLLWLCLPLSMMVPLVNSLLSSLWSTAIDPIGKEIKFVLRLL